MGRTYSRETLEEHLRNVEQYQPAHSLESKTIVTKRAGVIGTPLGHSLSPAMFKAAFAPAEHRRALRGVGHGPDQLEGRVNSLRAADFLGANVTIPHKQAVIPFLDGTSERRRRLAP